MTRALPSSTKDFALFLKLEQTLLRKHLSEMLTGAGSVDDRAQRNRAHVKKIKTVNTNKREKKDNAGCSNSSTLNNLLLVILEVKTPLLLR
ncbi:unnamed protein product [Cylicocyclus nassatus]|uniref:Uncharacterized protein n=1 Tax=Cylicocyclus nassatus TaxID=53992 RepID=A0AA36GLG8_CYLNA|nr:unnamed protein product [Cylicocyclus nassatus]